MQLRLPLAAITDEFTPDLEIAARAMAGAGVSGAERRVLWGRNILDLSDSELERAKTILDSHALKVVSIASPLLNEPSASPWYVRSTNSSLTNLTLPASAKT